jgi:hypothetical protein
VGDYLEFLAETNLFISIATCVQGDGSAAFWDDKRVQPRVYPLKVEVHQTKKGFLRNAGWRPSKINNYSRSHGMKKQNNSSMDVLSSFSFLGNVTALSSAGIDTGGIDSFRCY